MAHSSFRTHRKFFALARYMGNDFPRAYGCIDLLWNAAYSCNAVGPDGVLKGWSVADIEACAMWTGESGQFVDAAVKAGLLDVGDDVYAIHDFEAWAPDYVKRRWLRQNSDLTGHDRSLSSHDRTTDGQNTVMTGPHRVGKGRERKGKVRKDTTKDLPLSPSGNSTCCYCGVVQSEVDWSFEPDHFIPLSAGGPDDPSNIVIACHSCNQIKSGHIFKTLEDARKHIHWKLWTSTKKRYEPLRRLCFGGQRPTGEPPPTITEPLIGEKPSDWRAISQMLPIEMRTDRLRETWEAWVEYHKGRRRILASQTVKLQVEKLVEYGHDNAIESIRRSIQNGWQGLFPPEGRGGGSRPGKQSRMWDRDYEEPDRPLPIIRVEPL